MKGVTISNLDNRGHLAFDLRHILELIELDAHRSRWTVRNLECVGSSAGELHRVADAGTLLDGAQLLALSRGVNQVIDGEFAGFFSGQDDPWIRIRAVDSSFWDIFTDRDDILDRVRSRFQRVTDLPATS